MLQVRFWAGVLAISGALNVAGVWGAKPSNEA
jgi:hypothetical protein